MAQRVQLQLARCLAPQLQLSEARAFVQEATTFVQFGFHQDFIEAIWYLLPTAERYEFMQWHQNMPTGAMVPEEAVVQLEPPEVEEAEDEEMPEQASGSRDAPSRRS
eukprot:s6557_g2.t1